MGFRASVGQNDHENEARAVKTRRPCREKCLCFLHTMGKPKQMQSKAEDQGKGAEVKTIYSIVISTLSCAF